MRRYASGSRLLPLIETRAAYPVISGYNQSRQICLAPRRAPRSLTRLENRRPDSTSHEPGLRRNSPSLGLHNYSTANPEPNQSRDEYLATSDSPPEHYEPNQGPRVGDLASANGSASDLQARGGGCGAMSMVAQGKDEAFDRAVPSAAHYNDFREDLLRDPTSLPQKLRRTQFKWVTGRGFRKPDAHSHKRFGREIRLILRSVRKPITRCGWGSSKWEAQKMAFQQIVSFMDESGLLQLAFDSKTQKTQMGPAQKERNKQERTIEAIKLRMEHIRFLQDAEKRYNERLENLGKPEDFPVDSRRKENSRKRLQKRLALCLENRKHVETKVKNYQRMLENQGSQTAKAQVPEEKQREQQGGRRRTLMVRRTKNLDTLKQMELRLRLDDTLLIVMRRALWELRSSFSNTLKAASDGRKPSISISNLNRRLERSIGARTTLKTIMSRYLANRLEAYRRDPRLSGLLSQVGSLNLNEEKMKEEIIRLVDSNTYTIVEAATGSGKSTQIPRIILNNAIENQLGGFCKVICVQPRRIAASSVARRVASERDEPLGMSVGYHVRLDGIHPKRTGSITYCTTGILLELLRHVPGYLDSVSHIVLDEVHERDIGLDLLMLMLKVSIDERQAAGAHVPKVVVTSATVDVDLFASYFQNRLPDGTFSPAPHVSVPGRTFHVTKHSLDALIPDLPRVFTLQQRRILFRAPPTQMYVKEQLGSGVGDTLGIQWADTGESTVYDPKLHGMPVGLLCAAILYVLKTTTEGAILVFLPGLRDIFDVEMELENLGPSFGFNFSDSLGPKIFKLHSNLPEGHDEPFNRGEPGCRRIFLATNIAETSITITDVRFVIDTGKVRQSIYYPDTRASELGYSWISKSSATQRAGRAGRVRDGEYFALFTDKTYESFRLTQKPEMALEDLQELCLRVKNTSPAGRIDGFLRQAIEAPEEERVRLAIQGLQHTGALDEHEELTTLGHYLTRLPVHPTLGRLVILGIVFRCLDPLLITAALGNDLNIFRTLEDADAIALKSEIRKDYAGLSSSDQLTAIRIISVIRDVYYRDGPDAGRACADSHFVHFSRFRTALESARVIVRALTRMNLIPPQVPKPGGNCQFGGHDLNVNSGRLPLIKALLLHANTLNLAVPVIDTKKPEEIQETQRVPSVQKSLYRTDTMRVAGISMRSMNASRPPKGLIMYDSKNPTPTGKFDLHNTTSITPLTACLFGGPLQMHDNTLVVDSWLKLQVDVDSDRGQAYATKLLFELRKALDRAIANGIQNLVESNAHPESGEAKEASDASRDLLDKLTKVFVPVLDAAVSDQPAPASASKSERLTYRSL